MIPIKYPEFSHYSIDENGTIYSTRYNRWPAHVLEEPRIRKPHPNKNNLYQQVMLQNGWDNVKPKLFYVHRLVAEHFVPNPNNLPLVNHLNFDITDNRASNLEWTTREKLIQHSQKYNPKYCLRNRILHNKELLNEGIEYYTITKDIRGLKKIWGCSDPTAYKLLRQFNIETRNKKRNM
jgi:hypothetical protein